MCKKFIPLLEKRSKRSAIINVASSAGSIPIPYASVYSSAKA